MKIKKEYSLGGTLLLANFAIKKIIDFAINLFVLIKLGYIPSLIITIIIYVFYGIISVKIYDSYKTDFFRIEYLKKQKRKSRKNNSLFLFLRWIRKTAWGLFLSLQNPGMVVIYRRDGYYKYNGFIGKNVKLIFLINLIIVNVCWNSLLYTGVSIAKFFIKTN